jgi:hypothetical protein
VQWLKEIRGSKKMKRSRWEVKQVLEEPPQSGEAKESRVRKRRDLQTKERSAKP